MALGAIWQPCEATCSCLGFRLCWCVLHSCCLAQSAMVPAAPSTKRFLAATVNLSQLEEGNMNRAFIAHTDADKSASVLTCNQF